MLRSNHLILPAITFIVAAEVKEFNAADYVLNLDAAHLGRVMIRFVLKKGITTVLVVRLTPLRCFVTFGSRFDPLFIR